MATNYLKMLAARAFPQLLRWRRLAFGPISIVRSAHLRELERTIGEQDALLTDAGIAAVAPTRPPGFGKDRERRRSVVFLHNSYYNFLYLAAALRRRGWDAVSVSLEDPQGPHARFYHGEDVNLFDPDRERFRRNLAAFFKEVETRFQMVHFYGRGHMSFFPEMFDDTADYGVIPEDFLHLRRRGIKIGYSVCGCLDGVAQSSVTGWSGACHRCVWQHQPTVCADLRNLAWGHKVQMTCDLVATEGFPALDWQGAAGKIFREPLTTALDPEFWRPDLDIPERHRLSRAPGELIVYHGVGNYNMRAREGRDVKGTGAVVAAIDKLRAEGVSVRLEFVTDLPNTEVRFIQAQADVIVDQLNYGRYGAQAREGMMLGRPTVCYINKSEPHGARTLESIETCPLVSATEATLYDVLKSLLADRARRDAIGRESRAFAMKWHSADACAERFEEVYDRLLQGLPPATPHVEAAAV
jgi:glycosyltransferase involved in cell wall biosynthesis